MPYGTSSPAAADAVEGLIKKPAKENCFIRRLPPHSQVLTNVQYGFVFIATSGATVFDCRQASGDSDVSQIKAVSMIPDPYYRICRFACGFGKCELIIYSSSVSKPTSNSSALFGVLSIANWLIILFPASGIYLYETPFRVKPLAILDAPVSARFASVCKLATPILSQLSSAYLLRGSKDYVYEFLNTAWPIFDWPSLHCDFQF